MLPFYILHTGYLLYSTQKSMLQTWFRKRDLCARGFRQQQPNTYPETPRVSPGFAPDPKKFVCCRVFESPEIFFFLVKLCKRVCNVIKSASSPCHQLICSGHDSPFLQATELKLRSAGCCHGSFLISKSLQTHRHLIAGMFTHASIKIPR